VALPIESEEQVVEAIWAGVTERTRVLFLSHYTSPTALILPIEELIRRAREAGILAVIDGAHAPGQMHLDLRELGADFYSGNCHKWMMAPKGSGFLYARPEVQTLLEPLVGGWKSQRGERSRLVSDHEYQGTRDIAAFLSVPTAIDFMEQHDWLSVRQACHELVRYAQRSVADLTGLAPITPDGPTWFSQMAVLPIPRCDAAQLYQRLHEDHQIEIPASGWNGRQFVRLSVQGYNTQADIELLVEALAKLLPELAHDGA
jgi:isopenicillin-N epimerase